MKANTHPIINHLSPSTPYGLPTTYIAIFPVLFKTPLITYYDSYYKGGIMAGKSCVRNLQVIS